MRIRFENTTKRFGSQRVVEGLSLEIEDGEMMVLLGPSGCGKTTSLRMLAGLESVTEGSIYIGDRCVNDLAPRERDVAMVFQNYALYPHMTVYRNIAYPLMIRGETREEISRQVRRVAEMLQIGKLLDRRPRELSGGERQRVALARAVIRRPVAFLMDEPLSNLDARLRVHTRAELKRLQRELRITTVYVTHDQAEAMTLAHRVAVMNEGRLLQVGTPMDLYARPANLFVAGFVGSPPMNLVRGAVSGSAFSFSAGSVPLVGDFSGAPEGRSVILGFRPEGAVLANPDADGAWRARVYVSEEMGNETFVYVECGEQLLAVRADASFRAEMGDVLGVKVESPAIHLFDEASGRSLRPAGK